MEFSRQEHWSGFLLPTPGDLPDPGVEPWSPALQVDALSSEPPGKPGIYWSRFLLIYLFGYTQDLWVSHAGSVVIACRLSSCGAACRFLVSRPGMEPRSPALQGRFSTTVPPEKSLPFILYISHHLKLSEEMFGFMLGWEYSGRKTHPVGGQVMWMLWVIGVFKLGFQGPVYTENGIWAKIKCKG